MITQPLVITLTTMITFYLFPQCKINYFEYGDRQNVIKDIKVITFCAGFDEINVFMYKYKVLSNTNYLKTSEIVEKKDFNLTKCQMEVK